MKRNKLESPVEDLHNYVFFAVRNGKAEAIKSFIENYFLKKGYKTECKLDPRSLTIKLHNKKKGSWEYTSSTFWLEDIRKDRRFSDSYSDFAYEVGKVSIGEYFPRPPQYVKDFWDELKILAESKLLHQEVQELNFPFQLSKSPIFDSESLRKNKDENITVSIDSGSINAKRNIIHSIENLFLNQGYEVEAFLKDEHILIKFTNTKRGAWKECEAVVNFRTEQKDYSWNPLISYTYRYLENIEIKKPKEKTNKHYEYFLEYVNSQEFQNETQEILDILDYPFSNKSMLNT